MNRLLIALAVLAAGCARYEYESVGEFSPISLAEPAQPPVLVREASEASAGGADLHLASRVRALAGDVWVLDTGNDRLVRFDSALARAVTFGRRGEAPGELDFAMDMAVVDGRLVVAESGNGRLSVFEGTGAFRTTLRAPEAQYVAAARGRLYTTLASPGYYTRRVGGVAARHAAVPDAVTRLARSDPRTYLPAGPFVAAPPEGPLYVLDPSVLALAAYDHEGRMLELRLLPDPYRARLLERRRAEMEGWGARANAFVSAPATKQISVDDRGRLLIPFALPEHWGLLIDPRTWSARPLPLPADDDRSRDILRSASDAFLQGDRLYVLSGSRLYHFDAHGW